MSDQSANGNICHILPCSIDEDITAPIGQYFKPTALPDEIVQPTLKNDNDGAPEEEDDNNNKKNVTIMAAQFRGRGLLCAVDSPTSSSTTANSGSSEEEGSSNNETTSKQTLSKLPSNIIGVALSAQSGTSNNSTSASSNSKDPPMQPLKVVETFNEVYNWSHEHDVKKVMRERYGNDRYGFNAVLGWCDLSHEVSIL